VRVISQVLGSGESTAIVNNPSIEYKPHSLTERIE